MPNHTTKGFTLIELLIVIGIIVILAVALVLTLNPAELLRQARDSNRVSDLSTLKSAIALYLADVTTPDMDGPSNIGCGAHVSSTAATQACSTVIGAAARFSTGGNYAATATLGVAGNNGWLPINFTLISSGAPLSALPLDPINNATYFYAYKGENTNFTFELNADLESNKYRSGGPSDLETTDGGGGPANNNLLYEVGTAPGLAL